MLRYPFIPPEPEIELPTHTGFEKIYPYFAPTALNSNHESNARTGTSALVKHGEDIPETAWIKTFQYEVTAQVKAV